VVRKALEGLRVVDLSTLFAVPQVAAILADFGADVVKVEPPAGDPLLSLGPRRNGVSAPYALANRGKRLVHLDPDRHRAPLHALLAMADVIVSNQPLALLRRWQADPDAVLARNPRAVIVTVSAFGCDGPWAGRPGGGSLAEAFGGLTYLTGESDGPPMLPSLPLGDSLTGLAGVIGVLAACWGRDVRGAPGQHVDVAMYEPIITLLGSLVPAWTPGEPSPARHGSRLLDGAPRNVYECGDGTFVVLSAPTDAQVARLLPLLGVTGDDPRFAATGPRLANADELDRLVSAWIGQRPAADALAAFDAARLPCGPVHDLTRLFAHPQVQARASLRPVDGLLMPGPIARMSRTPAEPGPAPTVPVPVAAVLADWKG
jgi:crotonobetainyl-CoA:carnitine CoA-transferase CaiB-like acyl-CoA transferase